MADGKELVIVKELTERKSQVMSSSKGWWEGFIMLCMHMVHVNENFSFLWESFFDMQLPYFERRSCVFIVCSACGNARWILVISGLISLFEGETFWVPMLIGFEFMKMPAEWTFIFGSCQYGLDFWLEMPIEIGLWFWRCQ
jgi:hypothetical protein